MNQNGIAGNIPLIGLSSHMSRPLNISYCPLLPTRRTGKSLPAKKRAGRAWIPTRRSPKLF